MYQNNCNSVLRHGVHVIHGNRGVFHNNENEVFKDVYNVIRDYKFGDNFEAEIVAKILKLRKGDSDNYCRLMVNNFVKNMLQPTV